MQQQCLRLRNARLWQLTCKALYRSCLQAKDTTQSLLEMLVSLLKKCCCHRKRCGYVGCAAEEKVTYLNFGYLMMFIDVCCEITACIQIVVFHFSKHSKGRGINFRTWLQFSLHCSQKYWSGVSFSLGTVVQSRSNHTLQPSQHTHIESFSP